MKSYNFLMFTIFILVVLFISCNEYNEPGLIYTPSAQPKAESPSIISVSPVDSAIGGVREITINGKNFTANKDSIIVYCHDVKANIKSSTFDKIVVFRPILKEEKYGIPINIKIVIPGAYTVATIPNYKIENPIKAISGDDYSLINRDFYAMEIDKHGILWTGSRRYIYKNNIPANTPVEIYMTDGDLKSEFVKFTEIKAGPGDSLYLAVNKTTIYRLNKSAKHTPVAYTSIPGAGTVDKFDFDANKNMYVGKSGAGVYLVKYSAPNAPVLVGDYSGITFTEVRLFNNYLYASDAKRVFRSQILSDNTLSNKVTIVDLNNEPNLSRCSISSFNIRKDGVIYLCLSGHSTYSLFVLESDNSITPFYYENIIPTNLQQIIWGNDRYVYLTKIFSDRSKQRVLKMGMEMEGAPYYGRQF